MTLTAAEMLARLPTLLVGRLEFCECGHSRDDHAGGCSHVNAASKKRRLPVQPCACTRFAPDPRLPDGEVFVRRVLQKVLAKEALPVERVDLEDALAVLFRQLWRTSETYDSRSHIRFRVYAYTALYQDAIDHFRSDWGRHGQHRVYDPRGAEHDGDGAAGADRLDGAASRDPGDDPDSWASDAGGLLAEGDRAAARPAGHEGGGAGRGDANGDRRAGDRARRLAGPAAAGARGRPAFVDCARCGWRSYLESPNGLPGWHEPAACPACGHAFQGGVT